MLTTNSHHITKGWRVNNLYLLMGASIWKVSMYLGLNVYPVTALNAAKISFKVRHVTHPQIKMLPQMLSLC